MCVSNALTNGQSIPFPAPPCRIMLQGLVVSFSLILLRHLSAGPENFSGEKACHRESYGLFHFGVPPVSAPWATLPIVSSGNSILGSNMAVLSP